MIFLDLRKGKNNCRINIFLSAVLAALIFILIAAVNSVAPFGEMTVLRSDAQAQYAPFLAEYSAKLKSGDFAFYSWNLGGGNQLGLVCYYLLSPFNLISLAFNNSNIDIAFFFIILAKTMCMAASFSLFIQKKFKTGGALSVVFPLIYTFSGFYIDYYYNTMWLDALIMLPLIALGIENIVNGKKATLYFISLAYAIFVNFYMGYMICIFAVLYFFYLIFSKDISRNASEKAEDEAPVMKVMLKFGASSLFAGLICFTVILPVIYAIGNTAARSDFTSKEPFFNFLDFLSFNLSGIKPVQIEYTEDTAPYLMSSMLTLLTVPAFFFLKNVKPNKKVATAAVIAIFYFSFCIPQMNYFWHGFSAPMNLPYRFSFIYLFFILTLAYETVLNIKETPIWAYGISAALVVAALIYTKYSKFSDHFTSYAVIISAVFAFVYLALIILKKYNASAGKVTTVLLSAVIVSEMLASNIHNIYPLEKYSYYYGSQSEIDGINGVVKKYGSGEGINRIELLNNSKISNLSAFFNFNGLSCFSSLADADFSMAQYTLGNVGNKTNKFKYTSQTPVYNMLFSVKYVFDNIDAIDENSPFYEKVEEKENGTVYKVKYTLPFGVCASKEIKNWDPYLTLPIQVQNNLIKTVCGEGNVFNFHNAENIKYENCKEVDKNTISEFIASKNKENAQQITEEKTQEHNHDHEHEIANEANGSNEGESYALSAETLGQVLDAVGGVYSFKADKDDFKVSFDFTASEDAEYFAVADSGSMQTLTVIRQNGEKYDFNVSERQLIDIGYFTKGEKYTLVVSNPDRPLSEYEAEYPLTDSIQMSVGSVNEAKFSEAYNKILDNGALQIKEFEDSHIYGTVNAKSDCVMMLPMPYDEGWTVFVDGEAVELTEHTSHIMMFELSAGEHEIELSYFPLGLKEGIFVSAAAALGLLMVLLLGKVHKMKMELAQEEQTKDSDEKGKE